MIRAYGSGLGGRNFVDQGAAGREDRSGLGDATPAPSDGVGVEPPGLGGGARGVVTAVTTVAVGGASVDEVQLGRAHGDHLDEGVCHELRVHYVRGAFSRGGESA
jgi:hypothetical protein